MSHTWLSVKWAGGKWDRPLAPDQWPPSRLRALSSDPSAKSPFDIEAGDGRSRAEVIRLCDKQPLKVVLVLGLYGVGDDGHLTIEPDAARERGYVPKGDVVDLLSRDGNRCYLCNAVLTPDYQVDHIQATCNGGENKAYNWALTHSVCNNRKNGHMSHDPQWPDILERVYRNGSEACARGLHCKHPDFRVGRLFCHCPEQLTLESAIA